MSADICVRNEGVEMTCECVVCVCEFHNVHLRRSVWWLSWFERAIAATLKEAIEEMDEDAVDHRKNAAIQIP